MKLALGTVQFGLDYGAFNPHGQVSQNDAAHILAHAGEAGIDTLDTAQAYGESETLLARLDAPAQFRVLSKSPPLGDASDAAAALDRAIDHSCQTLGLDQLPGFMLHRAEDLLGPAGDAIWQVFEAAQADGRLAKPGISAYDLPLLETILDRYPLALAQLPGNILDPWYEDFQKPQSLELHVRSVFLQGFLLGDPQDLSPFHAQFRPVLDAFHTHAQDQGMTPLQAALQPLLAAPSIDRLVVGVDSLAQLIGILEAATPQGGTAPFSPPAFDSQLLDPRRWPHD